MRNIVFPALMLIGLCFATVAPAADQPYAYGGLTLGMSSADVAKALGDSTPDNTFTDWTVENDLGVMMFEGAAGKSLLAMFDQDQVVLLMAMDTLAQDAYDGLYASFRDSYGEPGAVPPEFAMKHEIFADFTPEDQEGLNPHFWGDPATQQVMATGYDPETSGLYLLLIDVDDSIKADARMKALDEAAAAAEAPNAEAPPAEGEAAPPAEEAPPAAPVA